MQMLMAQELHFVRFVRKKPHHQTESGKELMLQMVIAGLQEHAPAPLTNNDVAAWTMWLLGHK